MAVPVKKESGGSVLHFIDSKSAPGCSRFDQPYAPMPLMRCEKIWAAWNLHPFPSPKALIMLMTLYMQWSGKLPVNYAPYAVVNRTRSLLAQSQARKVEPIKMLNLLGAAAFWEDKNDLSWGQQERKLHFFFRRHHSTAEAINLILATWFNLVRFSDFECIRMLLVGLPLVVQKVISLLPGPNFYDSTRRICIRITYKRRTDD